MEDAAKKRKERLEALKRGKTLPLGAGEEEKKNQEKPGLSLRNYTPLNAELDRSPRGKSEEVEEKKEEEEEEEGEEARARIVEETVEETVQGLTETAIEEDEERRGDELDLAQLAPRKMDWDLKRALEPKMAILDSRTDRAIADLIRERLRAEQERGSGRGMDLAEAVATTERADHVKGEEEGDGKGDR
ncbi:MAG: cwf18 pre-mRNA splicing factor-domain-containing protein [Piptocephalis tieghemiana]|nr:MAG: cwf18 pre-mRNA splicing factor-domain-containing protein [Piptocephalis tieghemiana]